MYNRNCVWMGRFYGWDTKPPVGMHRDIFCPIRFFSIPIERRARGIASAFQNGAEVLQCVQTYRPGPTYETPRRPPVEIELVILRNDHDCAYENSRRALIVGRKAAIGSGQPPSSSRAWHTGSRREVGASESQWAATWKNPFYPAHCGLRRALIPSGGKRLSEQLCYW